MGAHVIVDRYACFMGSIGGLTMTFGLLIVWIILGDIIGYSNDNWWLAIGTYTGLVSSS